MVSKSTVLGQSSVIFVTVGSTNFPFDRLFVAMDNALAELHSKAQLVVQAGPSTYKWKYKNIVLYKYLRPKKMEALFRKTDRIITHGGFGTLFHLSSKTKYQPLVVARLKKYQEHINDHQFEFVKHISRAFPLSYKKFFSTESDIQNNIKKYIQYRHKENKLSKHVFPLHNSLENRLNAYIDTV